MHHCLATMKHSSNFINGKCFFIFLCGITFLTKLSFCIGDLDVACIDAEKKALVKFKEGLTDPSGRLSSWVGDDCCRWEGVSCNNRTGHVVELNLRCPYSESLDGNGMVQTLSGKINPSLLVLKYLNHLDLSMNDFGGSQIPSFIGSLQSLRYLNLSGASFSGTIPPSLGNLSRLIYLDLNKVDQFELTKSSLSWLSGLSSLKYLHLGGWDLSLSATDWLQIVNRLPLLLEFHFPFCQLSNLPFTLPSLNFTSLKVLDLSNNRFISAVPDWLFNLKSLVNLDLNSNNLYGPLPDKIANLASLENLDFSLNTIEGQLSKELGKLCNLRSLKLSQNRITGEITNILDSLSTCSRSNLETLNLGYNELTGNLPNSLGYLKSLRYLQMSYNLFQGSLPGSIGNLSSLEQISLSYNKLSGIPESLGQLSKLTILDISENIWDGLDKLDIAFNQLSGRVPNSFIFNKECTVKLTTNRFQGPLPLWSSNITELYLADNQFSGPIAPNIGEVMPLLSDLDVSYNSLSGNIPLSIGNLTGLMTLVISNNELSGQIPHFWENKQFIGLKSEDIEEITYQGKLKVIAKGRVLLYDSILYIFNSIDLSNNNLSGDIPMELTELIKLGNLNLSKNQLTGQLPSSIGNFEWIETLDISMNHISGPIPLSMTSLTFLSHLNLSYNNLSGKIPTTNQFLTLDDPSIYQGNAGLCGRPLSTECTDSGQSKPGGDEEDGDGDGGDKFEKLGLIISILIGFLVGFWGVCGTLIIKRSWRIAYFRFADRLSQNRITGEITDVLDSLSRCSRSSLETLNLGYNELTGNLPNSLGYLKSLRYLQMPNNLFQGSLPDSIGNLTSLEQISLSYNKLSGITKSLGQLSKLTVLDISENIWEGVITETHLTNLSSLKELTMDKASPNISLVFNISSDWIPPFKLTYLLIRSCQLGPKFPTWLKNQSDLNFVVLNNAMISDTIPTWFLNLDLQLNKLDIAYNQLSGRVPNSFRFNNDCTVDLSTNRYQGPLPLWSSNITMLYLRDNKFSGPIPPNIGEVMPLLTDLDISQNSLSGSIPLSIGNLTGLTTLVISNNELSGAIPLELTDLIKLGTLNLSMNHLTGQIPSSIGNLEWIETLDISMNQISGTIPLSMTSLTFLNHLNLSYNNLSGKIPTTNQFLTLDDPSIYQGNAGLCGKPLLTECPGSGQTTSGDNEEDRHGDGDGDGGNKFEKLGFIISIVFGFFVGFWGVCGTLIIKRSWRIAYFEFVDRVKDICSSMIRRMFVPKKQPWML
ncbi:hypothetical protein FEM48_Zijuj09G0218800 [Ziziphus jujuba var. spinosa]|uniref:Receptor-like protein EIX2 n=1 Tax=Ziziphus jujuba var. spinosa TaxID=714518 RepID=A0A978UVI8_ZIZJJ|nr:hypothetical protein FEM48_Zijuj09G0218800 [Ziziphus jujuba var. spinosa]